MDELEVRMLGPVRLSVERFISSKCVGYNHLREGAVEIIDAVVVLLKDGSTWYGYRIHTSYTCTNPESPAYEMVAESFPRYQKELPSIEEPI